MEPGGEGARDRRAARQRWAGRIVLAAFVSAVTFLSVPSLIDARWHDPSPVGIGLLRTLHTAQQRASEGDVDRNGELDFVSLAALGRAGLVDERFASGLTQGMRLDVWISEDGLRWFGAATAVEPHVYPWPWRLWWDEEHGGIYDYLGIDGKGRVYYRVDRPFTREELSAEWGPPADARPLASR